MSTMGEDGPSLPSSFSPQCPCLTLPSSGFTHRPVVLPHPTLPPPFLGSPRFPSWKALLYPHLRLTSAPSPLQQMLWVPHPGPPWPRLRSPAVALSGHSRFQRPAPPAVCFSARGLPLAEAAPQGTGQVGRAKICTPRPGAIFSQ